MPGGEGSIRDIAMQQDLKDKVHIVAARDTELEQARLRYVMALIVAQEPRFKYQIVSLSDLARQQDAHLPRTLGEAARIKAEIQILEQGLAGGRVDLVVADATQVPPRLPPRVELCALPPRQDARDVLVLPEGQSFADLRQGARIGLNGRRREASLLFLRQDLQAQPIEGTVESRLHRVVEGAFDAVIVPACDLLFGAMDEYREALNFMPFAIEAMCPRHGQGQLAVLSGSHRNRLRDYIHELLDDPVSRACAEAEQKAARALGYDRNDDPPAACHVSLEDDQLTLIAMNAAADQQEPQVTRQIIAPKGVLSGDPSLIATAVQSLFGEVAFIGAGPGSPDLVTRRGQQLLEQAEVIVYDRLTASTVLPWADPDAAQIFVQPDEDVARLLIQHARRGQRVARLTVGDPLVFDSCASEALELREAGIAYEIVPGVSSTLAIPAFAGIPLTYPGRSDSIHIYDGSGQLDYPSMAALPGSMVFVNVVTRLPDIVAGLIKAGVDPTVPAAIVQDGTLTTQRTLLATLGEIAAEAVGLNILPPALLVIGSVTELAPRLNWFPPHGRLAGQTCALLSTRMLEPDLDPLAAAITTQGGMVLDLALVQHRTEETLQRRIDRQLGQLLEKRFNQVRLERSQFWIVLNTPDAAIALRDSLRRLGVDFRRLSQVRFAVTDDAVEQQLRRIGLGADYRPENGNMDMIAAWLGGRLGPNDQVVSFSGTTSQSVLSVALQVAGVPFTDLIAYETSTHLPGRRALMRLLEDIDMLIFTSPAAVISFTDGLAARGWDGSEASLQELAIFATTYDTVISCRNRGLEPRAVPEVFNTESMMGLLEAYVREQKGSRSTSA